MSYEERSFSFQSFEYEIFENVRTHPRVYGTQRIIEKINVSEISNLL